MIRERLALYGQNDAYERGWREGWGAALATVQERGLERVLAAEKRLDAPLPMTLAFEGDEEAETALGVSDQADQG